MAGLDDQVILRPAGILSHLGGLGRKKVMVCPEGAQSLSHALGKLGVDLVQEREDLMADAIAGKSDILVGAVLHIGEVLLAQVFHNFNPACGQQGTNQGAPPGRHPGQALKPSSPDEVEQGGLHIVIGVVGRGNERAVQGTGGLLQEGIAHFPGGFLQSGAAAAGLSGHIAQGEGNLPLPAEVFHKRGVPCGLFAPELVVIVGDKEGEAQLLRLPSEQVEQAHGVGAARYGAQNASPRGEDGVFAGEGGKAAGQLRSCHRV